MTTLNIGVVSAFYEDGKSVVEVAQELQDNYNLFGAFQHDNAAKISAALGAAYARALFTENEPDFGPSNVAIAINFQDWMFADGPANSSAIDRTKYPVPTRISIRENRDSFLDTFTLANSLSASVDYA